MCILRLVEIMKGIILASAKKRFPAEVSFSLYRQTSNISRTLAGNKTVDHSDVVGAATGASSFST